MERLYELKVADRTMMDGWSWNCLNDAHPYAPMLREMARMDFDSHQLDVPKGADGPDFWVGN
jgi:hypothetical protein